jgi:L-rhamnose mutarotase
MPRYVLALDLRPDPVLIAEYEQYHVRVWPDILKSISGSGITEMEIYRIENRLMMIMETTDDFDFAAKAAADAANPRVQEWETLMWKYQQALPTARPGEKWMQASLCFKLTTQEKKE